MNRKIKDEKSKVMVEVGDAKTLIKGILSALGFVGFIFLVVFCMFGCSHVMGQTNKGHDETVYMEDLVLNRQNLTFTSSKDSLFVESLILKYVTESRMLTDEDYYLDVFLETDRPWDYLEFISECLEVNTRELHVSVKWDKVKANLHLIE